MRARLAALLRATVRMQRLAALTRLAELVAARRDRRGGWEIAIVRHGRLAAAGTSPPRRASAPTLDVLRATAETVLPGPGPVPGASRRGDRADPGLAGAPGDPAGGDVRRLGVTRPVARPASTCSCSSRAEARGVGRRDSTRSLME